MIQARAYADTGSGRAQKRLRRLRKEAHNVDRNPTPPAVEIVSPDEFEGMLQCLNSPEGPTPTLIEGAKLLRSLKSKNR